MAGEKFKVKKTKLAKIKKKNIADLNSWKASRSLMKKAYKDLGVVLDINRDSFNAHVRGDQVYVERLEATLTELMFLEKDLNKAIKAKDRETIKDITKEMKPLIKKEALQDKGYNNHYLWAAEEARAAKEFIKWIKTMPRTNKPKGL